MSIHPNTGIGHVHLTVSDLDRALAFYRDVLGFDVTSRYGRDAVFLSAGGYHHHIGLNTWAGGGGPPPPPGPTGLYHLPTLYPEPPPLPRCRGESTAAGNQPGEVRELGGRHRHDGGCLL